MLGLSVDDAPVASHRCAPAAPSAQVHAMLMPGTQGTERVGHPKSATVKQTTIQRIAAGYWSRPLGCNVERGHMQTRLTRARRNDRDRDRARHLAL